MIDYAHGAAVDAHTLHLAPSADGTAQASAEQRGATCLVILARADDAAGAAAAGTAIRIARAARYVPTLCRTREFWVEMIEHIDTYLGTHPAGGECGLLLAGIIDGRIVGAGVGDIAAWLFSTGTARELNRGRDADAVVGSALAEPAGFGPVPLDGTLMLATGELIRDCGIDSLRDAALSVSLGGGCDAIAERIAARRPAQGPGYAAALCRTR
ncbi:MAG: hypothetical protein AB7Q97_03130 [Gammaproteobacteria bacterium]